MLPPTDVSAEAIAKFPKRGEQVDEAVKMGIIPESRGQVWDADAYLVFADMMEERGLDDAAGYFRVIADAKERQEKEFRSHLLSDHWFKVYQYSARKKCHLCDKKRALNQWNVCNKCFQRKHEELQDELKATMKRQGLDHPDKIVVEDAE